MQIHMTFKKNKAKISRATQVLTKGAQPDNFLSRTPQRLSVSIKSTKDSVGVIRYQNRSGI